MLGNENQMLRNEIAVLRCADEDNNSRHFKEELSKLTNKINSLMTENQNLRFDLDSMRAHEKYHQAQNRVHAIFSDSNIKEDYNKVKIQLELAEQKIKELESADFNRRSRTSMDSGHKEEMYQHYIAKMSELQIENDDLRRTLQRQNPDGEWKASTTSEHGIKMELNKAVNENQLLKYENENLKKKIRDFQQEMNKKDMVLADNKGGSAGGKDAAYIKQLEAENERLLDQ